MVDYGPRLKRLLHQNGWRFLRPGKGDHEIWINDATGEKVSVDAGTRSRFLANRIAKDAGLGKPF